MIYFPLPYIIGVIATICMVSGVECTIYFHDKDYGLDPLESCVGLVQIDGLYTKTVKRWLKEMARVKGAIIGSWVGP